MIPDDIVVLEPTARKKGSTGTRATKPAIGLDEEKYLLETFEQKGWPQKIHFPAEAFWELYDLCPDGKTPLAKKDDAEPEDGWEEGKTSWVNKWKSAANKDVWFRPNKGQHVTDDGKEITLRGFSVAQKKGEEEPQFEKAKARLVELREKKADPEPVAEEETVEVAVATEEVETPKPKPKKRSRKAKN
jgi:hypothetical protein